MLEHPLDVFFGLAALPLFKTFRKLESGFSNQHLLQKARTRLHFPQQNLLCDAGQQGDIDADALRLHDQALEQLHHFTELVVHKCARFNLVNPLHDLAEPSGHLLAKTRKSTYQLFFSQVVSSEVVLKFAETLSDCRLLLVGDRKLAKLGRKAAR